MEGHSAAEALEAMRARVPLVQNITNFVAMPLTANVLLAAGASPAMVHASEEAPEFVRSADALVANLGTLSVPFADSMLRTAEAAQSAGRPWVLDPVAVGATRFRQQTATSLLVHGPSVIRGNASEIIALANGSAAGRGVESNDSIAAAETAARTLARRTAAVVAATGETDFITDGDSAYRVANGVTAMRRVSALGCALSAVVAAFATASENLLLMTAAACAYYGLAGERAAESSTLPGSFAVAFLDALASIGPSELRSGARMSPA